MLVCNNGVAGNIEGLEPHAGEKQQGTPASAKIVLNPLLRSSLTRPMGYSYQCMISASRNLAHAVVGYFVQ